MAVRTAPLAEVHDDPADDTEWERLKFSIRTWDVEFLRDNPLAQFYLGAEAAASSVVETAGDIASGANEAARGLGTLLKWAPYAAAGIAVVGLTAAVLTTRR